MRNKIEAALIGILSLVVCYLLWERKAFPSKPEGYEGKLVAYMDSMDKRNKLLFNKIDSIQKEKVTLYKEYTNVKLKYDTIQIAIDTMPDLDGTKFLLTISRQLTAKGIE
jgi:hypothetical protein